MVYPDLEMTQKEYDDLPKSGSLHKDELKYVPFGFRFIASDGHIAVLASPKDRIMEQVGAGAMGLPERGLNFYTAKIITPV